MATFVVPSLNLALLLPTIRSRCISLGSYLAGVQSECHRSLLIKYSCACPTGAGLIRKTSIMPAHRDSEPTQKPWWRHLIMVYCGMCLGSTPMFRCITWPYRRSTYRSVLTFSCSRSRHISHEPIYMNFSPQTSSTNSSRARSRITSFPGWKNISS